MGLDLGLCVCVHVRAYGCVRFTFVRVYGGGGCMGVCACMHASVFVSDSNH